MEPYTREDLERIVTRDADEYSDDAIVRFCRALSTGRDVFPELGRKHAWILPPKT